MSSKRDLSNITVGILGGGQLARMTVEAAARLNFKVAILEKEEDSPAGQIGTFEIVGEWNDLATLEKLARVADVITLENEFVDVNILQWFEARGKPVYPGGLTLALVQDKARQKQTLASAGLPVPAFRPVQSPEEVEAFAEIYGWPLVLKARRNGYDGKGNYTLKIPEEISTGFDFLGAPTRLLMVEQFIPFEKELAVMVVRSPGGEVKTYPVVETIQQNHICRSVLAPARVEAKVTARAEEIARRAIEAIGGVGVFGVELFLVPGGEILLNELAPRPHNSGHYTIEGCFTSQFENLLRAVLDLPLGQTGLLGPSAMVNLLGIHSGPAIPRGLDRALAIPGANIHLYGKSNSRPGRKMGHVTVVNPGGTVEEAHQKALEAAECIWL